MGNNSMIWVVVAVLVVLVLSSGSKQTRSPGTRTGSPYPIPGPSPLGTSWAQGGPAPRSSQTDAWDVANTGVKTLGDVIIGLGKQGVFSPDDTGSDTTSDDSYDTSFVESLPT